MISIEHLSVEFSARPLFADISYVINDRDRIALVGKNGAVCSNPHRARSLCPREPP